MSVRWGILGVGWVSQDFAAPAIHEAGNAVLHSVYSRTLNKAQALAARYDAIAYDDLEAFLSDPKLDAVYIATPDGLHFADAMATIQHHKHALVEKPLTPSLEEAKTLVLKAKAEDVRLSVGYQMRFHPLHRLIKSRLAETGRIGFARAHFFFRYPSLPAAWRLNEQLSGGSWASHELGSHLADLLIYFFGQPQSVLGCLINATFAQANEDLAFACIRFPGGITATLTCSTGLYSPESSLEIYGDQGYLAAQGTIHLNPEGKLLLGKGHEPPIELSWTQPPKSLYTMEFESFGDAVLNGSPLCVSAEEGLLSVALLEALRKSHQENCWIDLDQS